MHTACQLAQSEQVLVFPTVLSATIGPWPDPPSCAIPDKPRHFVGSGTGGGPGERRRRSPMSGEDMNDPPAGPPATPPAGDAPAPAGKQDGDPAALRGHRTNLVRVATRLVGSTTFNDQPQPLHVSGTRPEHAELFDRLE